MNKISILDEVEDLYFVFSDEWEKEQNIRLINISFDGIINYFTHNNGWDLWLYDVKNHKYVSNHFIPLVFKICK